MSTFINQPSVSLPVNQTSTGGLSPAINSLATKTSLNPGTIATVIAVTSQQLTLGSGNAKVTVNAATIPQSLQQGKDISFKLNTEKSTTLLEVSTKYSQQRLPLTQQQSQQVLQTVLQHPATLANRLEVSGQVVAVQKNQIQVSVGGQTVNLNVRNPQQYQTGQTVKLELSSGSLGWELDIKQDKKQENIRLPASEAQKILTSSSVKSPISLSQSGAKQIQPVLQQASDSVFPDKPVKVALQNVDGKLVANIQLSPRPLATIPLDNNTISKLEASGIGENRPLKTTQGNTLVSQEIQKVVSQDRGAGNASQPPPKNIVERSVVYQNPVINTKVPAETISPKTPSPETVSPNIDKTIKASQTQFTELKISTTGEQTEKNKTVSIATESIKEIKLTQTKISREEQSDVKIASPTPPRPENARVLSPAAQTIMATVSSLAKVDVQEIKHQVLEKLGTLLQTMQQVSGNDAGTKTAEAVLKTISQLSTQTTTTNKEALATLRSALSEINVSEEIAAEVKSFVRDNSASLKPEIPGAPVQTPDASKIRQLLQAPALPITPVSIISPPQTGGMVNGLVNLLQVALAARMNKTNQQVNEHLSQALTNIVGASVKSVPGKASGASLKDLSQIEQKHSLVKVLGDLLNQHTGQKIKNAERQLQGQEAFYYVLPFGHQENQNPAELLITREQPDQESQNEDKIQNSIWSLTIKLSVGHLGEILTKSKVTEEEINIDFYASNEDLKNLIFNYAPLLKKRFDELGLNLQIGRVERGNIPEQLAKNPYQILETRV